VKPVNVWNYQMNGDRAFAGDMRFNIDTQMTEIYDGKKWFQTRPGLRDIPILTEKEKALNELFGVK